MKKLLILTACVALLLSGCRNCSWFRKNRGAPCRSSLTFDPYTTVPGPAVGPGCGIDAYAGELACGQDVTVGFGTPDCPECLNGSFVGGEGAGYYPDAVAPGMTQPSVPIESSPVPPPPVGNP